jgi:hypothetical protein
MSLWDKAESHNRGRGKNSIHRLPFLRALADRDAEIASGMSFANFLNHTSASLRAMTLREPILRATRPPSNISISR